MSNPAPTINQINAFNATQGTTIDFNIIGGTELVRSNRIYIYDLSDNSLICTHLYVSTESIHELPANTDGSIVYESGKSSADFVNGAQYYAQIQTFTDTAGTQGGSGLSVAKMFWCLVNPTLTITTIPSTISTTSYNVSATYDSNTSVVSNIIQQYQFNLYSATGSLLQSSGVVIGSGTQQGTSTAYDISYNFTGLSVGSSYYVVVDVTTTQGMNVSTQSNTFTVSIDTPTVGGAIVNNNACDGYISVVSNLSDEYGGHVSGEMASFETDSVNNVSSLKVNMEPIQEGSGTPSPTNIRPIRGHSGVNAYVSPTQSADDGTKYSQEFDVSLTPTSTDKVPYTFKAVGRDVYGDRESDTIVGGTVAWNQLVQSLRGGVTVNGITITPNDDMTLTVNGTATGNVATPIIDGVFPADIKSHRFLVTESTKVTGGGANWFFYNGYAQNGRAYEDKGGGIITHNGTADWTPTLYMYIGNGVTVNNVKLKINIFDLTAMFGSTIADYIYSLEQAQAGAGVAWFKKLFPKDYYAYNAGELLSVSGVSSHDMVGFNAWDEEWELGSINTTTGANATDSTKIRSKNYIPVISNVNYYLRLPVGNAYGVCYDSEKNYVGKMSITGTSNLANHVFTTLTGSCYMRFFVENYGTTYNHDICINLSWDGERNGEYEAYVKHEYALDSSLTLRGVPKLDASNNLYYDGDEYESDGTVTRKYGIVDLGTLTWTKSTYAEHTMFYVGLTSASHGADEITAVCNKYEVSNGIWGASTVRDKMLGTNYAGNIIYLYDSALVDMTGAQAKEALSGVYLVYELATLTTETAEPFTNPQVVDNGGTEAYVTTGIVPVGHDSEYLTRDIFGGTLDLVSGVLTVDRAMVDLGTLTPYQKESGVFGLHISCPTSGAILCSAYPVGIGSGGSLNPSNIEDKTIITTNFVGTYYPVFVKDTDYTSAADFKTAMNGVQLVYELATPQTYQLTPHQIQTLVGQNNIWSDAGDVEVTFNLPISNLLVKRQDASDVSGDWLTLYSQPITQASDMDFTFIDFLNQYGKTYKYALVPLLTQTQSGVEVEVEGGYTVSDNVNSIFDGVYIADQTNVERVKAGVGYGNIDMNQGVGSITPIGSKYPIVITNSQNQYHNGSIRGTIVPNDFYSNGNLSRIDMVNKRDELEQFLTNKRAKIIKDWNGKMWLVMIMSNVACSFDDNYGMGMVSFSADWLEVGDPTNQQDLYNAGLINVGGV